MVGAFKRTSGGGLTITVDARAVDRALKESPDRVRDSMTRSFRRIGIKWEGSVKKGFTGYSGQSGSRLQNRSGNLRRSIQFRVGNPKRLDDLTLRMLAGGGAAPYAHSQEYGAVIKPKKRKYLTIPMPDALTPSGVVKGSALIRGSGGKFTTDMGRTFIFKSASGNLFVAVKPGSGSGRLRLLYILKKSVTLPGPRTTGTPSRLGGERTASLDGPNGSFIEQTLRRGLSEAFGGLQA